jgi:hypothetical protein
VLAVEERVEVDGAGAGDAGPDMLRRLDLAMTLVGGPRLIFRICSAVMVGGRPKRTPRVQAASRPSRVPSTISLRMNSACAAKTWKTSRPPGVVVSKAWCRLLNSKLFQMTNMQ